MKWKAMFLFLALTATAWPQVKTQVFVGEVADSSCAYNVHSLSRSHKEMLKSKEWGSGAADCTRRCVKKFGASYVLVHGNDVYKIEQQELADKFAGQKVKISGTLEATDKSIHIESIEAEK